MTFKQRRTSVPQLAPVTAHPPMTAHPPVTAHQLSGAGQLNLAPARPSPHSGYDEFGSSSWGGSIVADPNNKTWHMFVSRFVGNCGLGSWRQVKSLHCAHVLSRRLYIHSVSFDLGIISCHSSISHLISSTVPTSKRPAACPKLHPLLLPKHNRIVVFAP